MRYMPELTVGAFTAAGPLAGSTVAATTTVTGATLVSTVATGTAPFVVASTTAVANLNASQLLGKTWAAPGAIGATTPAAITGVTGVFRSGAIALTIGADNTFTTLTDATLKSGRIGCPHYLSAEEPVGIILGYATSTGNVVSLGGGTSYFNAATQIDFYTASNYNTTTGTLRLRIDSAGLATFAGNVAVNGGNIASTSATVNAFCTTSTTGCLFAVATAVSIGAATGICTVNNAQLKAKQFVLSALNTAPATAASTGTLGEIRIDASHVYVCTATNTWKRVAIATW